MPTDFKLKIIVALLEKLGVSFKLDYDGDRTDVHIYIGPEAEPEE